MTSAYPTRAHDYQSPWPLSARQALMWVDDQLYPSARYHNLPIVLELAGALDVARFSRAWHDAVRAHDALRLGLSTQRPEQAPVQGELPALPCLRVDADEVTRLIAERCVQRLNRGGFMWDAALIETAPDHHLFYICQDHILTDGMSQWVLFDDLAERYAGRTPPAVADFRDHLASEAAYLASPKAHDDRAYWERKLGAGGIALRPYGIVRRDRSVALDRVWHDAGVALAQRLNQRAKEPAFTAWSAPLSRVVVLATATAAFLRRISDNREIVLALPYANRASRFARTYGLLMQQLFLRIEVREDDTFASLAQTVKAELVQSIRHGQACVSTRDTDAFTLNLLPRSPQRFGDLSARLHIEPAPVRGGAGAGHGDLRDTLGLQVHDFDDEGALRLGFDCHAATFDTRTQARMRAQFVRVLEALANDANQPIDTLPLLDDAERRHVLRAARGREPQGVAPDVAVEIATQAQRCPTKVAVEGPGGALAYAELEAVSNRLARRLRALGVGPDSRVGIAMPRCTAELVAMLATLKAGGAYVPIDPSHPEARVRLILEDAAPEVLIAPAQSPLAAAVPATTRLLALDDLATATAELDAAPLELAHAADQLAYILFTSGSTGRPKGVEVTRGALANLMRSLLHSPGLSESDRWLAITTTTFDIASAELFLPLCAGATCVIADREAALDPQRLDALLARGGFSVLQATPATWRMLVEAGWKGDGRLRMFTAGEPLSPELAQALLERGSELWNLYGPTETTVYSTGTRVERGATRVSIGRPIDHTQVYVLDPARQLVPQGVAGEIYIGGAGVARGYHGQPDLTEQRFVPDVFAAGRGRMYRTGDLGRVLDDGRIECLGRVDHQVKIRGFRIELGEIESALRATPGVQEAVAVASGSGSAQARLIAYWTGSAERDALYACARAKLPQYMLPAAYVHMDAFPLTTSGKIDRKALPAPESAAAPLAADLRLPASALEQRVAAIWSEVLGVAPIGVDQDFFALGGSSILVVAVRDRIEREFATQLPLRVFFEAPTVAGIARALEQAAEPAAGASCLVRLKPSGGERCLFLIHDGDGQVLLYRNLALQMPDDVAVYGVVPLAERGLPMVHTRVGEMADHYVREIRARQPNGPYYLSGLCAGGVIAFEVARRLVLEGERVGLLALIDAVAPQARAVPLRIARARMRRFSQLIGDLRARGALDVARETQRRLHNIARYELFARRERLRARALVWLLARRYTHAPRHWPKQLPAPSVRDVYMQALGRYAGEPIDGIPSVLFRATEGAGDDMPVREVFEDPYFGWRELLGGSVRVIDSPGGHSTMLQQGQVDAIASHLRAALESASTVQAPGAAAVPERAARTRVTILVVSYKTAALVTRLLGSIATERERTRDSLDIRAIVVDNASGDAPALREAIAAERWHDWATLLQAERNGGFAYGNNLGFAHAYARGEAPDFFYLLNPDTEVRPGAIDTLVRFMQARTGVGIAGSSLETGSGEAWPYAFRFPSLQSELEHALGLSLATRVLSRKVVAKRMGDRPEPIDWIPGAALMVRRSVIDRVGGMDERYFLYYEETDFCRKVKAAGFSVWYVPQSRVMHIAGQSTGVTVQRDHAHRLPDYWFESRRRYFAKHHGVAYAMATDAVTLFAYALGRAKLALQRRSAQAVPGYLLDVARHSPLRARNRALLPAQEFQVMQAAS